jgi:phosphoglycolate phosphatase
MTLQITPMVKPPKLVIFDWDGTLMDSAAEIVQSVKGAAVAAGLPQLEDKVIRQIIGLGLNEALAVLYPQITVEHVELMSGHYKRLWRANQLPQTQSSLFTGAEEVLDGMHQQGIWMAVATGKGRRGLDMVLSTSPIAKYFVASRTSDETASKPDPLMLKELLFELNVDVADAVMVGDTEFDLGMAAAIDMPRIGVSYGVHSVAQLAAHQPNAIIDDITELHAALGI